MTDPRALARAYLEQQQSLGTDAVVIEGGQVVGRSDANDATASPPDRPTATLPPPGLSFDPPTADLFATDPLQQAHTIAAVAELVAECRKCRLCESRACG